MAKVFSGIIHGPDSYAQPNDGRELFLTLGGVVRSRKYFSETVYTINIEWRGLTLTQVNSINTDYTNNSSVRFEVDLLDSGGNVTGYDNCHWEEIPNFKPSGRAGGRFNGSCVIVGNLV